MSRKTRKLIWSAPLLAVLAVAGALAMFAALGPGSVFANPLPGEPTNLTVKKASGDAGRTTLVLSWDAPAGGNVSGYRIDRGENRFDWETLVGEDNPHTTATYMDDSLTSADTRFYRVFAVNSHGVSGVSNVASATTSNKVAPDPVRNLRAVANGQKQIDLSWDPPADNGGEKIGGYLVLYHTGGDWAILPGVGTTADGATQTGILSEGTSHEDKHELTPGESRNYRVIAFNADTLALPTDYATAGFGDDNVTASDHQQTKATTVAAAAPGRVTGLTAVNTGATQITLYWYGPQNNGGFPLSHYLVQAHRQGESFPDVPDNDELAAVTTTQPTLGSAGNVDNTEFRIATIATDVAEDGTTFQAQITTSPVDHDDDADTATEEVRWSFRVYAISLEDPDGTADNGDEVLRRSASASNTASKKAAARTLTDHDDDGTTAEVDLLAAPELTAALRTASPDVTKAGRIEVQIGIPTDGADQFAYRIDYSDDGGKTWQLLVRDTRFTGFTRDRRYSDTRELGYDDSRTYRAFALGANSEVGPASAAEIGNTKASSAPDKPTNVMASSAANRKSIQVSWTAPEEDGGQPISNYYVQYSPDDGDGVPEDADFASGQNPSAVMPTGDTETSYTIKLAAALNADTTYFVRVAAVNKDPLSTPNANADRPATDATDIDWSTFAEFNTSETGVPGMVEGLTSEIATDADSGDFRGVDLLWNKPSSGGDPDWYQIQRKVNDGDFEDWRNDAKKWDGDTTAYTDPDEPEADEMRTYQVRGVNADGNGPWAMVYYPREPAAHTHVAADGTIMPQEVTVGMMKTVNAAMYFSDAEGAMYAATSSDTGVATVMADAATGMVTITGVTEGMAEITVTATSGAVMAEQKFMVTVSAAALGAPSNVMAMVEVNSDNPDRDVYNVTVTWTDGDNSDAHWVGLYDVVNNRTHGAHRVEGDPSVMTHTFPNVPAGTYLPAVISTLEGFQPMLDYARQEDGSPALTMVSGQ